MLPVQLKLLHIKRLVPLSNLARMMPTTWWLWPGFQGTVDVDVDAESLFKDDKEYW